MALSDVALPAPGARPAAQAPGRLVLPGDGAGGGAADGVHLGKALLGVFVGFAPGPELEVGGWVGWGGGKLDFQFAVWWGGGG